MHPPTHPVLRTSHLLLASITAMKYYQGKVVDRQVGRNAELFAQSIAGLDSTEKRYPYLRILVSIVEMAHPEWSQAPTKDRQIAHLVHLMSHAQLSADEIAGVVRVRDEERGFFYDGRTNQS